MAASGGKVGVYIPQELAEAWAAWEDRTGRKINLSGEVQGVIRRLIGEPSPEDVLTDRVTELAKLVERQAARLRTVERSVKKMQSASSRTNGVTADV